MRARRGFQVSATPGQGTLESMSGPVARPVVARAVRRMGFGATGAEIDTAAKIGLTAYIRTALSTDFTTDPGVKATPVPKLTPPAAPGKNAGADQQRQYQLIISTQLDTLTSWWLHRMIVVQQPVQEKLTLLWHNHFATSAQKVRLAGRLAAQNEVLRTCHLGDFRDLAYAMLTDAAMLQWLDGVQNTKKAPNENLAREFLELFALGHGNAYTEHDVQEAARALTGWRITPAGGSRLEPALADQGSKTVLGRTGKLGTSDLCDVVVGHPDSARFVATRLWRQLVADASPPDATIGRAIAAYGPRRDLRALTEALLLDPAFADSFGTIVIGPVEWLIGAVRALRIPVTPARLKQYQQVLRALGQLPFYPPTVGGWPSGQGWLSTVAADTRLRASASLVAAADLSAVAKVPAPQRVNAIGELLGIVSWTSTTTKALHTAVNDPRRLAILALNSPEYLTN